MQEVSLITHFVSVIQKALQDISHGTFTTELNSLTRYTFKISLCRSCFIPLLHRFRHPNLINLMGFCQARAALVYPYMENLSLFHALHEYKVSYVYVYTYIVCVQ